jgi:hypothetical protein
MATAKNEERKKPANNGKIMAPKCTEVPRQGAQNNERE